MTNAQEKMPTIKTYNDFVEQLNKIKEECSDIVISFYKYCWLHEENSFDLYKGLIINELKPYGLQVFKVTEEMNIIIRFKKIAEAVIYIKPYSIDFAIYKRRWYVAVGKIYRNTENFQN